MPTTYVLGVGPGLGAAVSRRFAREGHAVALMARRKEGLEPVRAEIEKAGGRAFAVEVDAASEDSVAAGFKVAQDELGPADVFVYNASTFARGGILELDPAAFEQAFRISCMGALLGARQVLPHMIELKRGTILLTGATASMRGSALRRLCHRQVRAARPRPVDAAGVSPAGHPRRPRDRRRPDRQPAGPRPRR